MERFLRFWSSIGRTFHSRSKRFPLATKRQEFLEVYGVLHAITNIIKATQNSCVTGPLFLTEVCSLMNEELDVSKPLELHDPTPPPGEAGQPTVVNNTGSRVASISPDVLTDLGRTTRQKLHNAIKSRFIAPRYNSTKGMKCHDICSTLQRLRILVTPGWNG